MQLLLIVCLIAGLLFFSAARRRLDTFAVAFFSAALYFMPGIVGYTLTPVTAEHPVKMPVPLDSEAVAIMLLVLVSIPLCATVWDRFDKRRASPQFRIRCTPVSSYVAVSLGVLGFLWAIAETGPALFSPDKRDVIGVVGRGHLLWEMGAAMGAVFAYIYRRRVALSISAILLIIDMWIGFRYAFAMAFIGVAWLALWREDAFRLSSLPRRYLAAVALGGLAIISYQNLKEPVRQGDWTEVSRRLSSPAWYAAGVMTSEPFTTQTVLNEVVRNDFRTGSDHLWSAALHLIVFSPSLGAEEVRFNRLHQAALFPTVDHGLADNIWAQMWSATGWVGLMVFVLIYNLVLAAGAQGLRCRDPALRAGLVLLFAYWCFYIHRNELIVQVGYMKQVVILWSICVMASNLLDCAASVTRGGAASFHGPWLGGKRGRSALKR